MRATLVRVALLASFVGIAAPVAAQRTGPCPPAAFSAPAGPRPLPDPVDCLFAPNGDVRAALYPATASKPQAQVHVFRDDGGFRSEWNDQPDEILTVPPANHFSDLDRTTLERVAAAAGALESAPDGANLLLASYAPTTPSTQGATTDLRVIGRTYDDFDRLSSETVPLQDGRTATVSYTYWNNGQRKTVTDVLGRVTFYEYDGQNRLSRLTANQGLADERVTTYAYWPDSLLRSVAKPDGTVTTYDYDRADRLTSIAVRKGATELLSYAYVYDRNGNRTEQVERNGWAPETTTYTYDDLHRLETVTYPDGRRVAYGYDDVGNRTSETERDAAGVVIAVKVAVFDSVNRLSTVTDTVNPANNATFAYDTNGNLAGKTTAAGTETYHYDTRDQLVETRAGASITGRFAYDAFGRRYLKIGSEGLRQYLYDQTSLLEEFNDVGTEVAKYDWSADRLVSLARLEEPRRFFHFDALGSVAALTDEFGSVGARYHYDAWGRHRDPAELDASANRFGFTGHYFDTETKLYYAKARYFDPDFGRFLTQDNYLGEVGDPPSLNRYLYARANPGRYTDPSGHFSFDSVKQNVQEGLIFGVAVGVHFQEEAGKAYDRFIDRTAMLLVPGATARQRVAAGQDPGLAGGIQLRLLGAARNPDLSIRTRLDAFTEAVRAQPAVIAEETIVRPVQEAPERARAAGVHLAQAATATSAVETTVHLLEATKEAAEAFTGFAGPAALATGLARAGPAGAADEVATSRPTLRAAASAEESQYSSQVGRGQQVFREGEGTFVRGGEGEFVYAEGTLGDVSAARDLPAQAGLAGKLPGDQAGHALAARFGFTGKAANLVPMAPELNLSAFKKLENHLARLKADGRKVTLEVWGIPGPNPQRPDRFFVVYTVDGKAATATFDNPVPKP